MNKTQLLEIVAEKAAVSKRQAKITLEVILEEITQSLKNSDNVRLMGFGTFKIRQRGERICRNPKTGKVIYISSVKVPIFISSKSLKDSVK
ncbi:HU family DNA-binding protein [Candidatus Erwinia haradaeae]|uniref:DNA-binding protein HU-alpha n=1 Tax=Candidatus Erwinia haradaeae TaxID=1922217 RepID=A0A451D232_9GAMM|nr:HU family DNA-binding protein [Candidatus Erwinia haradaeae]VFP79673.1 DNA-binding protein HU-alpha [Candidatus Erwinia haradaeae]